MQKKLKPIREALDAMQTNDPELFGQCTPPIIRLHRLHDYLHHDLEQILNHYGLQRADFGVIESLRRERAPYCLSPTNLSLAMLFSSGGLTKVLHRVTQAGFITRLDNPEDKRSKLVQLTAEGKQVIEEVIHTLHAQEKKTLSILTDNERNEFDRLLRKVLQTRE